LLAYFREIVPSHVRVTLLADRGFGDQALYRSLVGAHLDFVIRFRDCIHVTDVDGNTTIARELVSSTGRARKLTDVRVTQDKTPVPAAGRSHQKPYDFDRLIEGLVGRAAV
jgi:hypothetical protein